MGMTETVVLRTVDDVVRVVDETTNHADPAARRKAARNTMLVMVIALGGVFVDAYDFTSLGIGAIQLRHEFHLTATQVGALSSTMAFSALFGALVGGYFVDKLGRKRMFLLDLWFFVFSAIGAALAPNLVVLLVFRLLMGLGVGLDFPVAMSFVAEFSDRANRGRFVNLSYLNWYLAAIVGFVTSYVGYVLGAGEHLWRLAVGFGAVPALILLMMRNRYMLESPLWAAHQGDLEGAAEILRRTRNLDVIVAPDGRAATTAARSALSAAETARIIFSPRYRPRATLAAVISCLQSIEYYAVIFYLPVISQLIFGRTMFKAILGGIVFSAVGLVGSAFQAFVCDRTGIRPLTIAGALLSVVALLGLALGHATDNLALEALMVALFMVGHTIGPGPQGMAYGTLSFPTAIRGSAVGWTQGMLRVGSITGFFFFPVVLTAVGFGGTFTLLAAVPLVIALVTLAIPWEPIGVDIEAEPLDLPVTTTIDLRVPGVALSVSGISMEQVRAAVEASGGRVTQS
ncbi:MAG TPA: MFS transporter [Acidimicrobiia bacterium]|nr:MFS transporter [Acidimicrobiia bacterium]